MVLRCSWIQQTRIHRKLLSLSALTGSGSPGVSDRSLSHPYLEMAEIEPGTFCMNIGSCHIMSQTIGLSSSVLSSQTGSDFSKVAGLMRDDTLYEDEDVKEALKRLPEDMRNERLFRIKRALDLSMRQQILPKDQWVKYEEDKFYLEPYLKEVIRERREKEEWEKK
ncbi:cytochrome b-c1 complex subunit 7 isoform X1 [Hemicordylus capensis]|uniref:cytochrome b-c1 complex subunit 7 isoform X1 n=1 Tax=Hemicordylus capensis TaxID=884348 RepID=UPI002302AD48|nr:cytochrome b-c1 complex subunit 7 isoform X1 [Hemicordylus capensis]